MECYSQEIPKCPICGNDCGYRRYKHPNIIFLNTCGNIDCIKKLVILKSEQTSIKKYGCRNAGQSKQAQEKRKKTCIEKYGVPNIGQAKEIKEKIKRTCIEKYGITNGGGSKQALDKIKETNLRKRGVPYVFMSNEFKKKAKETWMAKYGVDSPSKSKIIREKIINTNHKRYGKDYPMSCDWFKENIKKTCQNKYGVDQVNQFTTPILWDLYKENMLSYYGVDHPFKLPEIRRKIENTIKVKYGVKCYPQTKEYKDFMSKHIDEINIKRYNTKKKNNTFNTSKPEDLLYIYIKEKFPSVERQYNKDNRYPFACDFYIPELDLFLELNGTWIHGKHPYDPTSQEDQQTLEQWKEKYDNGNHPMYLSAINGWTKRDVKKRNIAIKEKLNFKEVWSLKEGKKFIDELFIKYEKRQPNMWEISTNDFGSS